MSNHMPILTKITGLYASFRRRRLAANWTSDVKIFLKSHDDLYNLAGLELALLHLSKLRVRELSLAERKRATIETYSPTVDLLLSQVNIARSLVTANETVSARFYDGSLGDRTLKRFDDYFATVEGHAVELVPVTDSVVARAQMLIQCLQALEVENRDLYAYYLRKLRRLVVDLFHTLQALIETNHRPPV